MSMRMYSHLNKLLLFDGRENFIVRDVIQAEEALTALGSHP